MLRYLLSFMLFNIPAYAQKGLDTVLVFPEIKDSMVFAKKEFSAVIKAYPGLTADNPYSPDLSYSIGTCDANNDMRLMFSSEAGKDEYYMLYAYFLKQKAKRSDSVVRRKLLAIFQDINELHGTLRGGGTYFGHQYARILGYAEYALYCYKQDSDYYHANYSVVKQKNLFIQSLRQYVIDELQNDGDFDSEQKSKTKKQLATIINGLDKLITNKFYLKAAMEFEYSHY